MTEILRFKAGDRVRVIAGDFSGQLGTVERLDSEYRPGQPVEWSVALDDGETWRLKTEQLEHADE